mmetsp:Transcript_92068/g.192495  ORF Transcript_92068/g.192495 Transcript_92068/m.192495 type:complete len:429 (+) Transcript_92068:155-1441(+)
MVPSQGGWCGEVACRLCCPLDRWLSMRRSSIDDQLGPGVGSGRGGQTENVTRAQLAGAAPGVALQRAASEGRLLEGGGGSVGQVEAGGAAGGGGGEERLGLGGEGQAGDSLGGPDLSVQAPHALGGLVEQGDGVLTLEENGDLEGLLRVAADGNLGTGLEGKVVGNLLARPAAAHLLGGGAAEDRAVGGDDQEALSVNGRGEHGAVAEEAREGKRLGDGGGVGPEGDSGGASMASDGDGTLIGATGQGLGLEKGGPSGGGGDGVNVEGGLAGLEGSTSEVCQVLEHGHHLAQPLGDRLGVAGELKPLEAREAALHGARVHTNGRASKDTSSSDLCGLALARLGRAVAGIASLIGGAWRAEERGVGGALGHDLDGEADGQPNPRDEQADEADLDSEPGRGLALLAEGVVYVRTALCVAGTALLRVGGLP